ncbi:MAG: DNA mismatch repair protein MutS [Ruminococcus sp.]|nr:DNA mismatch repair protein MutS [Ruminococcus sp.]
MDFSLKDNKKLSPMMRQYLNIKEKYQDYILFFRLGDFYEMFFDDALEISKALELTLTGKDCGLEKRAEMCGIPYHSSDIYIKKLVDLGYKVAICEQLTDPALSKGLVERDVIKIITPGTLTETTMLDESSNNYICSTYVDLDTKRCGLCFTDISTGKVLVTEVFGKNYQDEVINLISQYNPAEIVCHNDFLKLKSVTDFIKLRTKAILTFRVQSCFNPKLRYKEVRSQFSGEIENLNFLNPTLKEYALCGMFNYIADTQKSLMGRFVDVEVLINSDFMELDYNARRNLELTETIRSKDRKGSLVWVLDKTETAMGRRLLKSTVERPLIQKEDINNRLDAVEILTKKSLVLMEIKDILSSICDIERLMGKVVYKNATPRDLKALSTTALQMPLIKEQLSKIYEHSTLLAQIYSDISTLEEISNLIESAIVNEPPISIKDGGFIKEGFNSQLDELKNILNNGKDIVKETEYKERERTGIKNLKIGYNKVFGYFIEITKSNYNLVPDDYIRKQTLTNAERYITEDLKTIENTILSAEDRSLALESEIFTNVRNEVAKQLIESQKTSSAIALLDMLCSFAEVSLKNNYCRPNITTDGTINIKDGRHPVVELTIQDDVFVPNDTFINTSDCRMAIVTGPNMAGKSTFMRQTALITLMAQIGSFVPCTSASISIVDRIFTRVGASDDLSAGQSTFMVEMSEVADILKYATKNSLIILDEVGRGTSTFDGISIAQSVAEYISLNIGCKTLFATHYHELIELEDTLEGVKNFSVAVQKQGDTIKFLRKIIRGGADDSYGIEVGKLAGLPQTVIDRAKIILHKMES